ncbi:hypothetical protein NDU88_001027 [Pleurodeles waltl]|uniref:Uncharacterized protein n=1 Tax=Pleurodeles waltl TaxID=8319 RepID=A0AAV7P2I7_PLEWA|nr:hypothetical protein NDU88_001027 [Pleurodeles waltl]
MPRRSPWRLGCQGNTQRMRCQSWKTHAQRLLRTDARAVLAPRKRLTPTAGVLVGYEQNQKEKKNIYIN